MPLHLRLPKRGFTNIFKQQFQIVNLHALEGVPADKPITAEVLRQYGKIKSVNRPVKILGQGQITAAVTVVVSAAARRPGRKSKLPGEKLRCPVLGTFQSIFKIEELRKRIFYTPQSARRLPNRRSYPDSGIDSSVLESFFSGTSGTLLGMYDMFAGGAFEKATIFAMGIMPYISASIIMQLLAAVVPYIQKLQKEARKAAARLRNIPAMERYVLPPCRPTELPYIC